MYSLLLAIIYLSFISLGLPDSLLGSAWPVIYRDLGIPMGSSGIIFMIISLGTVFSSLMSDRVTRKLGTGLVTSISVAMTAFALFGFSLSHSFEMLCLFAIPYGLGAGSVDAALNNYVALHYASRHMSWLHCMWGIGATTGPYIMSLTLSQAKSWNAGYSRIGILQLSLTLILLISLPLWAKQNHTDPSASDVAPSDALSLKEIFHLNGAVWAFICFFCYCALEQTVNLWASSYLVNCKGLDEVTAAGFASLFFIGITSGRGISGFITFKLNDRQMVWLGHGIILIGILLVILPLGNLVAYTGLIAVGLGCAPIYPSLIHATPYHFGADHSQSVIGVEMASAYIGTSFMPPLFGLIAGHLSIKLFPVFLLVILLLMGYSHRELTKSNSQPV